MDKMSTNNSSESSPSDTNKHNVSVLEEQQQPAKQSDGPRRFFCDDVLLDALHFLRRNEHNQVRLASRRLQWLSDKIYARYPPRVVPRLEVRGVYALPTANDVPHAEAVAGPRIIANSMRVLPPASGISYPVDFPSVEPPADIVRLSELKIYEFIGPELLQFLGVSARLLANCWIRFYAFDNFVRHHSIEFIIRFFDLFPSGPNRTMDLNRVSSLATPLFTDHPAMFDCTELVVECLNTFPLDALQGWLHLDEQLPEQQQIVRHLIIRFGGEIQLDHLVPSLGHFVQQLRQRFLGATSRCPFTVDFGLFAGDDGPDLDTFVERNKRTGELLEFRWDDYGLYSMERRRLESTAAGQDEEGIATITAQVIGTTVVHIHEVVQGDKQPED